MKTTSIDPAVLARPVSGQSLRGGTLSEALGEETTLLVFLRHLGCLFCRELVTDLRVLAESTPEFPPVLFVHQGNEAQGKKFFDTYWPDAPAISDPERVLYGDFDLGRARMAEMFSPSAVARGFGAMAKGHLPSRPIGDPWQMPGVFLVENGEIIVSYDFRHAGDHPDFSNIVPVTIEMPGGKRRRPQVL